MEGGSRELPRGGRQQLYAADMISTGHESGSAPVEARVNAELDRVKLLFDRGRIVGEVEQEEKPTLMSLTQTFIGTRSRRHGLDLPTI